MDLGAMGNILGGVLEGTLGLVGGIVITVFAFKVRNGKNNGRCPGGNGHCADHKELVKDVKETRDIAVEVRTDVKWLRSEYQNGNGRTRSKKK